MRASFVSCVLCSEYLCYTFARIEERMVGDKGGVYFDTNWLEVEMKYSYSLLVRQLSCRTGTISLPGNFSCVLKSLLQPPPAIEQTGQK